MPQYDITLVTMEAYVKPTDVTPYIANVLKEDELLKAAFEAQGLIVNRTNWDNPTFDWTQTKLAVIRSTWDYFNRANEFTAWLNKVQTQTRLVNDYHTLLWNMDKHYLADLSQLGINIVQTQFIEVGDSRTLAEIHAEYGFEKMVVKPAVSGAARHTYVITAENVAEYEAIFKQLIAEEAMLVQPFLESILTKGEVSHMVFGGVYSHSVLKIAKAGDFRVQDDFGGTVHNYIASPQEIAFAEKAVAVCKQLPVYARVDLVWNDDDTLALAELELIEPELWLRNKPAAANYFAKAFIDVL